ncbi:MAG: hypothetical protein KC546_03740 [Anaerolineae bacterium]|nr:hypothetical protein [Anaerolineae bacterium]
MKTRLIFVGGFLGAGKTTLLTYCANALEKQGHRVAVVTNDQGQELVDTMLMLDQGTATGEVKGGCFCCRFHDLVAVIEHLSETYQPDIILAEPVGSCTDIISTVIKPLESKYPDRYEVAPFAVMVDPTRDLAAFPESMSQLFRWQLEEADQIILNKIDSLSTQEREQHLQRLQTAFPNTQMVSLSARSGEGVAAWLAQILSQSRQPHNVVPIDYIVYAEAEAVLGWLNASLTLQSDLAFSAKAWVADFLGALAQHIQSADAEIAHIKTHLHAGDTRLKASLTSNNHQVEWDRGDDQSLNETLVLINARVRCEPDVLESIIRLAIQEVAKKYQASFKFKHVECFSPAAPEPIFRM